MLQENESFQGWACKFQQSMESSRNTIANTNFGETDNHTKDTWQTIRNTRKKNQRKKHEKKTRGKTQAKDEEEHEKQQTNTGKN